MDIKSISKKDIKIIIEDCLGLVVAKYCSSLPSKQTDKFIQPFSKKPASHAKDDVKKQLKDIENATKVKRSPLKSLKRSLRNMQRVN